MVFECILHKQKKKRRERFGVIGQIATSCDTHRRKMEPCVSYSFRISRLKIV